MELLVEIELATGFPKASLPGTLTTSIKNIDEVASHLTNYTMYSIIGCSILNGAASQI